MLEIGLHQRGWWGISWRGCGRSCTSCRGCCQHICTVRTRASAVQPRCLYGRDPPLPRAARCRCSCPGGTQGCMPREFRHWVQNCRCCRTRQRGLEGLLLPMPPRRTVGKTMEWNRNKERIFASYDTHQNLVWWSRFTPHISSLSFTEEQKIISRTNASHELQVTKFLQLCVPDLVNTLETVK